MEAYTYDNTNGNLLTTAAAPVSGADGDHVSTTKSYANVGNPGDQDNGGWMWRLTNESVTGRVDANNANGKVRETVYEY
ncbi:MAG: hypothetical protein PHN75_00590 [Syntrophales bacterium]|nr:hypothetical protein [Syntrophales bacterium]